MPYSRLVVRNEYYNDPSSWLHFQEIVSGRLTWLGKKVAQTEEKRQAMQPRGTPQSPANPEFSNEIFIVHGHDGELKHATARLVATLELQPVILHEQPNRGRTIIEKFSDHAQTAGFAIVLLSADDEGRSKAAVSDPLKDRARQNVIFEMGFFFRHLGRGRVCAVYQPGVERPSDIQGILYVEYDPAGKWVYDVAKEIKAAGYKVDLNKL
jgi:predicted nucleotide-binding protein